MRSKLDELVAGNGTGAGDTTAEQNVSFNVQSNGVMNGIANAPLQPQPHNGDFEGKLSKEK